MNVYAISPFDVKPQHEPDENEFGETPLPYAPVVEVEGGAGVVPQQYLEVRRSLSNVEAILSKITTPEGFLLFAAKENDLLYLVTGIIGHENYGKKKETKETAKLVYGRRWLIEPSAPTSEVVQTAILAIKKAREHELRERFVYYSEVTLTEVPKVGRATPFNCHLDLPLMVAECEGMIASPDDDWNIDDVLSRVRIDNMIATLEATAGITGGRALYDINIKSDGIKSTSFNDLDGARLTFLCQKGTRAEFLHEFFCALLKHSDESVDESTRFEGFARFSRSLCPEKIGNFSRRTRNITPDNDLFDDYFEDMSYRVDAAKAPPLNSGALGVKQRFTLDAARLSTAGLAGYLPKGYRGE